MRPVPLRAQTLEELPSAVGRPRYDLGARQPSIVHLGFGGFHRAHMAHYTHDLMQTQSSALQWGIVGAGLLAADRRVAEALVPQNALYTLVERSTDEDIATVMGSIVQVIYAADDPATLLARMDRARIVSLTVTETGYGLKPASKRLDPHLPAVAADLADPFRPKTPIGLIVEAARRRMTAGGAAFTALSCDNIQHNGQVLRQAVLDYADRRDGKLAAWIAREVRFPSTMVDRITPAATPGDVSFVAATFGIDDHWPVLAETFRQWVIEDDFADGRPDWSRAGAQFVDDVSPYEIMKLRLLNASHLAVAGLGRLLGHVYIHEAMADPNLSEYMRALMDLETGPTLGDIPGVDLAVYKASLLARFANSKIMDTVDRVNADAPLNYLLDPIRDRLAGGQGVDLLALGVAAWMRRVRGVDEAGRRIEVRHPLAEELRRRAEEGGADPRPLLALASLFGDLADNAPFAAAVRRWLGSLYEAGAAATLRKSSRSQNGRQPPQ